MARVKSIPMRRKAAAGTTSTIVSGPSLNTRIHRILNAAQELKVYSGDTNYVNIINATGWQFYINPLSGITQGTNSTNRIGDKITVYKIEISSVVYNTYDNVSQIDMSHRLSLIRAPDTSLTNSTATVYAGRYTNTGFSSNGPLDTTHNTVYADKKGYRVGSYTSLAGSVMRHPLHMTKSFGARGLKCEFQASSVAQADRNLLIIGAGDSAQDWSGILVSQFTIYVGYSVYYRDA